MLNSGSSHADAGAKVTVNAFHAGRGINGIAVRRLIKKGLPAKITDHGRSGMHPDSCAAETNGLSGIRSNKTPRIIIHGQCRRDGALSVVRLGQRRAEKNVKGIADYFIDSPFMLAHYPAHAIEIIVEYRQPLIQVGAFHQGGKTGKIGEYTGDFQPFSA